jgi:hypothetical protein
MLPKWHILLGAIFAGVLLELFPKIGWGGALVIFLSSVFIDMDHYSWYVVKKRDWNLKKSYIWHIELTKRGDKIIFLHVLHTIEVLILLGIFSYYSLWIFYVFLGFVFHSVFDFAEMAIKRELWCREFFFINWLRKLFFPKK